MKKPFALASILLLTASMSFAQQATGSGADTSKKPQTQRKAGGNDTPSATGTVSLNPQPLPPKQANGTSASAESKVALNPQPLPPGRAKGTNASAESKVELNPQPLPPGAKIKAEQKNASKNDKKTSAPDKTSTPK